MPLGCDQARLERLARRGGAFLAGWQGRASRACRRALSAVGASAGAVWTGVTYSTDRPLRVRVKTGRTGWVWVGVRVPFWSAVNTPFPQLASHRRRSSLVLTPVGTPSWFFFPMWAPPPWLSPMWPHFLGLSPS